MKRIALVLALLLAFVFPPAARAYETRHVVIVVIDGGRYTETLGHPTFAYEPFQGLTMAPQGSRGVCRNSGLTVTNPGHAAVLSGAYQAIANDGSERPHLPTLFEYYRAATGAPASQVWFLFGKDKLDVMSHSDHPAYGAGFGATVEAALPTDAGVIARAEAVLLADHPAIMGMNLAEVDEAGHTGNWNTYVAALQKADSLVHDLWTKIQADPELAGRTALFVTNDHGRHDDAHGGFQDHGCDCDGCRRVQVLAMGPDFKTGHVSTAAMEQVDIVPTVGALLGIAVPYATGRVMDDLLLVPPDHDVAFSEGFESFTTGQTVGTNASWFDDGDGPVVQAANGVAGSRGLAPATNIFVWRAHPFSWSDAAFDTAVFQMDFQASAGGADPLFDDDRIGWMTTATSVNSNYFFGVQLDPVTDPNTGLRIEAYWRNANESRVVVPMADVTGVEAGAWYRLRLEVTKLGASSASLAATLQALDSGGNPGAIVASGSIANTAAILPDTLRPHTRFFSGAAWPAFKNYDPLAGAADNAYAKFPVAETTPDDALARWAFDDGSGSTAADGSGNGNTATVSGATWTTGHFDGALAFDGVNDRVVVPASASLDRASTAMTIAFWLRGDVLTANWVTAMQRTSASGAWFDWQLYARASDAPTANRPVWRVDWNQNAVIDAGEQVQGDIVLSPNTWYFIACTYDGSAMRFYIDGTQRGSTAKAGSTIPNGGRGIWMGGNDVWGEYFDGRLDDVRIYDRALSLSEIQALMTGAVQYHVNVSTVGSGSVARAPDQALYDLNQVVLLTASAAPGWEFTGWSGDLAGLTNPQNLTVTREMAVSATFAPVAGSAPDTLVATGAVWKYRDDGSDQGTAWRGLAFSDASWASGPAELGYGDGDEQTVVGYGPDPDHKYTTTYFRHAFELTETGVHNSLRLDLLRDDGAIVYLNGVEVFRSHMPAGTITAATFASTPAVGNADELTFYSTIVDPALLRAGTNVLAVEIHQVNATSTDISFDLRLTGSITLAATHAEGFDALAAGPLHDQPGWRDDDDGPAIGAANGVAGSHGLTSATDIFTWQGHPFSWNDPLFQQAVFELDFQSSAGGTAALFDDDRIGWMTSNVSALSDSFFGVQLDPIGTSGGPNVETYWRNASGARVDSLLVNLSGLIAANTWYRLRLEVLKLGATSARLDVAVMRLAASGDPEAVIATGALASTGALGAGAPASRYFTAPVMYPAYKNYDAVAGGADNAFARIVTTEAPPMQLASLAATAAGAGRVQLDWSTLTETRNAGFEVQRSSDSSSGFATLPGGFVAGHGTTRVAHAYGYTDSTAGAGDWYYRLRQVALNGDATTTAHVHVTVTAGVGDDDAPLAFALEPSRPNPCRGSALIRYALPRPCHVTLEVYGVTGQKVATLADGPQKAGSHAVRWEAQGLPTGVYWYRLNGGGQSATRKVLLLR